MERRESPPPPSTGRVGKYDWEDIVRRLKAEPGTWLCIDETARLGLQTAIRNRKMRALQDPAWNFRAVIRNTNREAGTAEVWMSAERED